MYKLLVWFLMVCGLLATSAAHAQTDSLAVPAPVRQPDSTLARPDTTSARPDTTGKRPGVADTVAGKPALSDSAAAAGAIKQAVILRPVVLRLQTAPEDRPVLRRFRYQAAQPDSLAALQELTQLTLALREEGYLTASADTLFRQQDTLVAQLYLGPRLRWARLQSGNVSEAIIIKAGFAREILPRKALPPGRAGHAAGADPRPGRRKRLPLCLHPPRFHPD